MKKFTIAAAAALALASAAPAMADTKTSDDPFISTAGLEMGPAAAVGILGTILVIGIASSGDS
ncbi:hypothetical protein ACSSNL_08355 [Thalassobius sp. S69A]|uniref:hypothetical protein n=1 Tax=unclassified Thalassovita TaxID=2619711 RepID=UPI000C645F9F|nr:hypothetical protein [Paracoccaceae bacterium]